jgi:hypothetical protein
MILFKKHLFDLEVKGQGPMKVITVMHPHTKYWPISKDKNVVARTRKYYLKNNYLTFRSRGKVPRRSLQYTTHRLWSCTHIPNIIDLSGKTKKLWSGQVSLRRSRRSGRKNQTKTIYCMISDNVFSDWLKSLVTFFDKMLYSPRVTSSTKLN